MLKSIQKFFSGRMAEPSIRLTDREASDHALRLATAALLIEVTRADREVADTERDAVLRAVTGSFGLSTEEAAELVVLAEQEARDATSLYQFTELIDRGFDADRKRQIVEMLWRVVFADAVLEPHEEALVRRVAGLIHVPHKVFIDAKIKVRAETPHP